MSWEDLTRGVLEEFVDASRTISLPFDEAEYCAWLASRADAHAARNLASHHRNKDAIIARRRARRSPKRAT